MFLSQYNVVRSPWNRHPTFVCARFCFFFFSMAIKDEQRGENAKWFGCSITHAPLKISGFNTLWVGSWVHAKLFQRGARVILSCRLVAHVCRYTNNRADTPRAITSNTALRHHCCTPITCGAIGCAYLCAFDGPISVQWTDSGTTSRRFQNLFSKLNLFSLLFHIC